MKKNRGFISILTFVILGITINLLAKNHSLRVDLTENRQYTLSASTKKLLHDLDDVVTLKLYFTQNMPPALLALRRSVEDILDEFKKSAGNRLQVEYQDPAESAADEQKAAMLGIPPVQLNVIAHDRQEVAKVYLGMAILFGDKQEVIPVVQRVDNLEYELTQAILKVSTKELPQIGWYTPKSADGQISFDHAKQLLSERYKMTELKDISEIDISKMNTVVMANNTPLSDAELFAIDQFVMKGGRLVALIERFEIAPGLIATSTQAGLTQLLTHYGVTVNQALAVDRSNAMASFSGGVITYHLPYPYWPQIRAEGFTKDIPMVSELEALILPWTSPLTLAASTDERHVTALASTTAYGVAVPGEPSPGLGPEEAGKFLVEGKREALPLAAFISGNVTSLFGDEGKKLPQGATAPVLATDNVQVVVVGSSNFLQDRFLQLFPANAVFFENAIDTLAFGDMLIGIRSREASSRPLELVSDSTRTGVRTVNLIIGPLLVCLVGVVIMFIRRNRHHMLKEVYS